MPDCTAGTGASFGIIAVSVAADGLNVFALIAQLDAQAVDVRVDSAQIAVIIVIPHLVENLTAAQRLAGVADQISQQLYSVGLKSMFLPSRTTWRASWSIDTPSSIFCTSCSF